MKKLLLTLASTLMASLGFAQGLNFTVTGDIKGLDVGDTIRFERISLPDWSTETAFEIIVTENDKFSYIGSHPHTQIYSMRYHPIGKEIPNSELRGLSLLIKDGETQIEGERNWIYNSNRKSNIYDSDLRSIQGLKDSLSQERSKLLRQIDTFRNSGDTASSKIAVETFNNFHNNNSAHFDRLRAKEKAYFNTAGNEYVASELCQQSYRPLDELDRVYQNLKPEGKESYYGKLLYSIITKLRSLAPGQAAPDFKLTTLKGETITLKNFGGKYLLIYHFGLCPGSMQADPQVKKLHDECGDRVEIVGITESMENLKSVAAQAKEGDTVMGMDFKAIMTGMTNHPWRHEAETTGNNSTISEIFNIQGLPFFICISPDGKIVSRGFFEAFEEAKKAIQPN